MAWDLFINKVALFFWMPWSERYRPNNVDELILSDELYERIYGWFERWNQGEQTKRALILYGEQGTGKTTSAVCMARKFGLEIIEMNASSQRNREKMQEIAGNASRSRDIFSDFAARGKKPDKLILVDEADNIFDSRGAGDTGGVRELSNIIRSTANPIVLTMNDYYDFRRKNGADAVIAQSEIVEFKQYRRRNDNSAKSFRLSLTKRIRSVLSKEGKELPASLLNDIFDRDGIDIRSIFNDVEAAASAEEGTLSGYRDSKSNIFEVMRAILLDVENDRVFDIVDESDLDLDLIIQWVNENLSLVAKTPSDLERSFDALSTADLYSSLVIRKQHFGFMRYSREIVSLNGSLIGGERHYTKFEFPTYLRNMSTQKAMRDARKAVISKLARYIHTSRDEAADQLWFFSEIAKQSGELFSAIVSALKLSDEELKIILG